MRMVRPGQRGRPDVCPTLGCGFEAPDPDGDSLDAVLSSDGHAICPEHGMWHFFVDHKGRAVMAKTRTTLVIGKREAEVLIDLATRGYDEMEAERGYLDTKINWTVAERVMDKLAHAYRETHELEQS